MKSVEPSFRSLSRDERRERILWAAKHVMLEKGVEEASMDDVAAAAGTTKPTVYAHFGSKDELFAAVVELIKGLFLGKLKSPEAYGSDPVEAVALFCARFVELSCWRDAVAYQRVTLAAAARTPGISAAVYDALFAGASRSLSVYLRAHKLTRTPDRDAELVLAAACWTPVMRHLFGVEPPNPEPPSESQPGARADLKRIRETVALVASRWKTGG